MRADLSDGLLPQLGQVNAEMGYRAAFLGATGWVGLALTGDAP